MWLKVISIERSFLKGEERRFSKKFDPPHQVLDPELDWYSAKMLDPDRE
jgi:hypothetical protein